MPSASIRLLLRGDASLTPERVEATAAAFARVLEATGGRVRRTLTSRAIGCDGAHDDPPRIPDASPEEMAAQGWVRIDGRDYCPGCAQQLRGEG